MSVRHKISRQGLELIKGFEGLRQTASRLPDGRWTIGYGHTLSAREGATVSADDAEALLLYDLMPVMNAVNSAVSVPVTQSQFDALVSFAFNIGLDLFQSSNVLDLVNQGRMAEAASALDGWRTVEFNGQTYVLEPLVRRREAEKALLLASAAPSEPPSAPPQAELPVAANDAIAPEPAPEPAPSVESPPASPEPLAAQVDNTTAPVEVIETVGMTALQTVMSDTERDVPEPQLVPEVKAAPVQISDPHEEKRKADAEAALMRFYSPYGTSLAAPLAPQRASAPLREAPPAVGEASEGQIDASTHNEGPSQPQIQEAETAPVVTPVSVPPAPPQSAPVVAERHWRDVLQRPLPSSSPSKPQLQESAPPVVTEMAPPLRPATVPVNDSDSLFSTLRPTQLAAVPSDPVADEWANEDRIALTLDEVREVDESWLSKFLSTLKLIIFSCLGMVCIGGGLAAYLKGRNSEVMRQGFVDDYTKLSAIMAAFGVLLVFVAIWLILRRLAGLKT